MYVRAVYQVVYVTNI